MGQFSTCNLYLNTYTDVREYCGTIQLVLEGEFTFSLVYTPGGPCTAGAPDQPQTIQVAMGGSTPNLTFTGRAITVAGVAYPSISASWDGNEWWNGLLGAGQGWQSLPVMAFPYDSAYLFVVSNPPGYATPINDLGGTMSFTGSGGTEAITLTVEGNTANGTLNTTSSQLDFGQATAPFSIALPNGVTYNFQGLFYAFTQEDGRPIIWGTVEIAGQVYNYCAIQWPALALPLQNWPIYVGQVAEGAALNFTTMLCTEEGKTSPISTPSPVFTFTDPKTTDKTYQGVPQITVNAPGGYTGPTGSPTDLDWNFGGAWRQQPLGGPPVDNGSWDSTPEVGQVDRALHAQAK